MAAPSPTKLAELMGLSLVPGPPVLKKPTLAEVDQLREMYIQICGEPYDSFLRFASQLSATYLPNLIRTLLIMPMSVEGGSGLWWELHVAFLDTICLADTSGYLQRFLREKEAEALKLYVLVLESLGALGALRPVILEARLPTVRNLFHLWEELYVYIPLQLPSLVELPRLSRQTLDGLTNLDLALPTAGRAIDTFLPGNDRTSLSNLVAILGISEPDDEMSRELVRKNPMAWWSCEVTRDVERWKDSGSVCVQLAEGEEMEACSRCLTVRYCSKDHQRLHWKEHKKVCFKTEW